MTPRIYMASKTVHGPKWVALRESGHRIVSTWIDESGEGASDDLSDLWTRCINEASTADVVIAVHGHGEEWKGAFVEIGAALACGVPVIVVGHPPGSWTAHPLVSRAGSVKEALASTDQGEAAEPTPCAGCSDPTRRHLGAGPHRTPPTDQGEGT